MRTNSKFQKTVFENGLTLVSERQSEFRSLSMGIWVKVGTRHERSDELGVSHFLEHMLFKGTRNRSALDIAREVDQVGGEFNAFTAREHTCFHLLLLDRDYKLGLDLLTDVLLNSEFRKEEMERERKVILQEVAMVQEAPEELAHDLFFANVYGGQGLGMPILGTEAHIKKMQRQDLVRFFNQNYRPDQLVVSVAGNVAHETLKKYLNRLGKKNGFGKNRFGKRGAFVANPSSLPEFKSGFWWTVRPTEQVHLVWGVKGPHYASSDRFAAFLLNVYLGGGMSSSLFQEIREKKGLAYSVYSSLCPFIDSGVFSIYVATGIQQVPLCLDLIEKCVERIKTKALSKRDLKMIQNNLKGTLLLSADSVESRMSSIAKNEIFFGKYVSIQEVCAQIDAVTPDDLQRMARVLFQDPKRSIVALGPAPSRSMREKLRGVGNLKVTKQG